MAVGNLSVMVVGRAGRAIRYIILTVYIKGINQHQ